MDTRKRVDAISETLPGSKPGKEQQEIYIGWLRERASRPDGGTEKLYAQGWKVARRAAQLLREQYRVTRVRVFGSLVHPGHFHQGSDIDLAVEGLPPSEYWEAVTATLFLDDQVPVELVDRAVCRSEVWEVVEREGVEL